MTSPFALSLLFLTASANDSQADGVHGACEAALHEQRSIYESKLASLRQQLESASRENCENRTQLASLRAASSHVVDQDADVATGPPSNQSVPDGADSLGLGLRLLGRSSSVADTSHSVVRNRSSSLEQASNIQPQNARGAVGRSLLQAELEDRACSKAEAHAVLSAAVDPMPIVMGLMGTNPSCALCIIGCVGKKTFDAVVCVHSCQHQRENVCDKSTGLERLTPLISNASLGDRDSLVRLILLAESDCTPRSSYGCGPSNPNPIYARRVTRLWHAALARGDRTGSTPASPIPTNSHDASLFDQNLHAFIRPFDSDVSFTYARAHPI
jgi:hypothetical protein